MGQNGTAPHSLFQLYQEYEEYDLTDPAGRTTHLGMRKLTWAENLELTEQFEGLRKEVDAEAERMQIPAQIEDQIRPLTHDQVLTALLTQERQVVAAQADLAPEGPDDEGLDAAARAEAKGAREREALTRWETDRRAALEALPLDETKRLLVERRIGTWARLRQGNRLLDFTLTRMVVDPATREPLLALDPKAPNYIGRLAQETREALITKRGEFLRMDTGVATERQERAVTEDSRFLPSGESPRKPGDTPGETIAIPFPSPSTS